VINEESITLIELEDAVLNLIQENEVLAYSYEEENKYQELSTVLFEGSARTDVTTELKSLSENSKSLGFDSLKLH